MSQAPGGPHKRPSPGPSTSSLAERRRIACHLCRSRKTRCDNQRPPCGYCAMNGTACAYPDEPSHPPDAVVSNAAIMDRLNHAISLLERADHVPDQQAEAEAEPSAPPSAFADDGFGRVEISDAAARVSSCEAVLRWPVLQGMGCVKDTPASFGLEAAAAGCVQQQQGAAPQDDMLQLCQRFLALVHIKNPILDAGEFTRQARHAAEYGPGWDAGGCAVVWTSLTLAYHELVYSRLKGPD